MFGFKAVAILVILGVQITFAQTFAHPGMLNNDADFARIREQVNSGKEPWKGGWDALLNNWHSLSTYNIRGPADTIYRGADGVHGQNFMIMCHDASAAYANALRWKIAGTEDNAKKAIEILNAYASRLKAIGGTTDALLAMGLQGYQFANAAEIMRTYPGWSAAELKTFQDFMIDVFYGLPSNPNYNGVRRFLVAHNGTQDGYYWANWDLAALNTLLAIGILCDNRDIYNEGISYFKSGSGNGNITKLVNFVYDGGLGQWQESGRDQGHTSMGPPLFAIFCEMAWKQGDDLYGFDDNRLLKGSEYVAKYNMGNAVPFTAYNHPKNFGGFETQTSISNASRNTMRTGWELIYNHYVVLKGLHAPYSQIAAYLKRPEGGPWDGNSGEFDLIGYSTLTASLNTGFQKQDQTITWADTTMTLGGPDLDLGIKASSGLPCFYTLSDYTLGEIVNNKVHAYKAGTLAVTAWQTGDEEYNDAVPVTKQIIIQEPATYVQASFDGNIAELTPVSTGMCLAVPGSSINEGSPIIQWRCTSGKEQKWRLQMIGNNLYQFINVNSGLALDVVDNSSVSGSAVEQRSIVDEAYQAWSVLINTDGTYRILNNGNNLALGIQGAAEGSGFVVGTYVDTTSQNFRILIEKQDQSITFGALPQVYPGDADIELNVTSSASLPIKYTSTNPSVATVTNGALHVLKGGTTAIIASQPGNEKYNAAFDVTQWLVTKMKQALTVRDLSIFKLGDKSILLGASTSSGLPLSIASTDTTVAKYITVSDSLILGLMGTSIVTFTQQGDETYLPFFTEQVLTIGDADTNTAPDVNPIPDVNTTALLATRYSNGPLFSTLANGLFVVSTGLENANPVQVNIFDLLGNEHFIAFSRSGKTVTLDLQALQSGPYIIRVIHNGKTSAFRILKN